MIQTPAEDSALLGELRALADQGRYHDVLERLGALAPDVVEQRTPFALLAAEAHGRLGHTEAVRWSEAALRTARARGEPRAEMRAVNIRGLIALRRGDVDEAEGQFAVALDLARTVRDDSMQARCLNNLGIVANLRGDPEAALTSYHLALAAYQQAGLARGIAETHHNIGISWRDRGDFRRALQAADQAVRLALQVHDDSLLGLALAGRAELHLLLGDALLATAELAQAAEAYDRVHYEVGLAEVWRVQAAVASAGGDLNGAVALLERAAERARALGAAYNLADIERDLGVALEARGDAVGARQARQQARELYTRLGAMKAAQDIAARLG